MNRSIFGELWYKAFRSGNPLYLFIAINVLVFLSIHFARLIVFLAGMQTDIGTLLYLNLALPADPQVLLYKPWTLVTYMFSQQEFFHFLFNMLWLYWLGQIFLSFLNKRQFVFTYLAGGLAGALLFLLAYNLLPVFRGGNSWLIGASAGVNAIVLAAATLVPDYSIRMLFFGNVRLKYLALVLVVLDILFVAGANAGGSIAHLGGALLGFVYIRQLQRGTDWSKVFNRQKKRLKVVHNDRRPFSGSATDTPDQEYIDSLLDKISRSGYNSLSKAEKEALFKASKQDQQHQ